MRSKTQTRPANCFVRSAMYESKLSSRLSGAANIKKIRSQALLTDLFHSNPSHPLHVICLLRDPNFAGMDLVGLDSDHILAFLDLLEHCDHRTDPIDVLLKFGGKLRILFSFVFGRGLEAGLEGIRICFEARKIFGRRRITRELLLQPGKQTLGLLKPNLADGLDQFLPGVFRERTQDCERRSRKCHGIHNLYSLTEPSIAP